MSRSDLSQRLDEPLEPEDALAIARQFDLKLSQFSATPTLREMIKAGDLTLEDVAQLLEPENNDEDFPPEFLAAEKQVDRDVEENRKVYLFANRGTRFNPKTPLVVDRYGRPELTRDRLDNGVTEAESEWLATKFGLGYFPKVGTKLWEIVEESELDPDEVAHSLAVREGKPVKPFVKQPRRGRRQRLVDLNNPDDVKAVYEAVQDEERWRNTSGTLILLGIGFVILIIASAANSCSRLGTP
jgi:hypothetical protein